MSAWDELLQRDAEKIKQIGESRKAVVAKQGVEPEFLLLAEFGLFFGWQAVQGAMNNEISFAQMHKLLEGARRVESINRYNRLIDAFAVKVSPHDKNKMFNRLTEEIKRSWQTQ